MRTTLRIRTPGGRQRHLSCCHDDDGAALCFLEEAARRAAADFPDCFRGPPGAFSSLPSAISWFDKEARRDTGYTVAVDTVVRLDGTTPGGDLVVSYNTGRGAAVRASRSPCNEGLASGQGGGRAFGPKHDVFLPSVHQ